MKMVWAASQFPALFLWLLAATHAYAWGGTEQLAAAGVIELGTVVFSIFAGR
jgi:hypothetical protein